jgi:hypothetical protein
MWHRPRIEAAGTTLGRYERSWRPLQVFEERKEK